MAEQQIWDLWYPAAAAQGLPFARGRLDATDRLLVHAAPDVLDVDVRADDGRLLARGKGLKRTEDRPISRLAIAGDAISRVDLWPVETDLGLPVILPGGEVGILVSWWNAEDGSAWRWRIELYNHRQIRPVWPSPIVGDVITERFGEGADRQQEPMSVSTRWTVIPADLKEALARFQNTAAVSVKPTIGYWSVVTGRKPAV